MCFTGGVLVEVGLYLLAYIAAYVWRTFSVRTFRYLVCKCAVGYVPYD